MSSISIRISIGKFIIDLICETSILLVMADIRNGGKSRIDIENGELIDGDLNLRMFEQRRYESVEHPGTHPQSFLNRFPRFPE